ncbi:MAG: BNR repeat-containing protein, partial [Phycisphaerae bacterium]|nr:BNR repeat-containing protein [Phycisphaerae bacterium]
CTLKNNDAHRNTCLGLSAADGRLHLSWDHHGDQLHYTKSRSGFLTSPPKRMTADDIEPPQHMLADPKLERGVTYPRFLTDRHDRLFFFYRIGGSGNGDNYLHQYDPEKGAWTRIGMLFSRRGTYKPWNDSKSRCAYLNDLIFDEKNRLHATWVYREIAASWASNHDLHYAYSDDMGRTWLNNAGEKIADLPAGDPIELGDAGIVVREVPVYSWMMNANCMALDSKNRPHVVLFKSLTTSRPQKLEHSPPKEIRAGQCFFHYWRDDDGTWQGGEPIDPKGTLTRRVDAVFDARDTLYFFHTTPKGFHCYEAKAVDRWRRWISYPLTGPELTATDASKHDRVRWEKEQVLSITAKPGANGFAILDFVLGRGAP